MTEEYTKLVVDCVTGEQSVVPLTQEEIDDLLAERARNEEARLVAEAEAQAKAEAKASALAKLAALGLTEEEAAAIAGA